MLQEYVQLTKQPVSQDGSNHGSRNDDCGLFDFLAHLFVLVPSEH
jgi:hypothetical protein